MCLGTRTGNPWSRQQECQQEQELAASCAQEPAPEAALEQPQLWRPHVLKFRVCSCETAKKSIRGVLLMWGSFQKWRKLKGKRGRRLAGGLGCIKKSCEQFRVDFLPLSRATAKMFQQSG